MSTHNICFYGGISKIIKYPPYLFLLEDRKMCLMCSVTFLPPSRMMMTGCNATNAQYRYEG